MWSSRLFWKFLSGFVGLIGLSALIFGVLITDLQEGEMRRQFSEHLRVNAVLLSQVVASSMDHNTPEQFQEMVESLGTRTDCRLTVISLDGRVLADSMQSSVQQVNQMDDHRNRPELIEAGRQGVGFSERFSATFGESYIYRAVRVDRDQEPIALARVSLPVRQFEERYERIRQLVWFFAAMVICFAIGVGYVLVARIIQPLTQLTSAAERIAAGDRHQPISVSNRDEIGILAASFNRMSNTLTERIDELRERRDQLAAVLGGMDEGVIALDDQTRILFANDLAGQLFEFEASTAQGLLFLSTIRDEMLREAVEKAFAERSSVIVEIELRGHRNGILSVHISPLPGEPCPGVIMVIDDLTELRRLESLRQDFVANVSHELKTPLSSIKAYAETLRNGAIDDRDHNVLFVQRIEDQADRLYQLILDLLSLTRIESGQETYEMHNVVVRPIVEACLERHQAAANAKSIQLIAENSDSSVALRTDDEALLQILDNLVTNAIKYTPADGRVVIRWGQDNQMGLIEVSDTGIGIATENQDRLFERFYRVDKARSRELGGTGLGLSIVKHLVQFFGGNVGVESQPGKGSTFWVRLPLG
ncbi:MAG: ATP-binding protein [Pirellulaceae bacterium]|nr:ATP-binding protein [Pirellulaceae bacterium]